MDPFVIVPEDENLKDAVSFVDDGFVLDADMLKKYQRYPHNDASRTASSS